MIVTLRYEVPGRVVRSYYVAMFLVVANGSFGPFYASAFRVRRKKVDDDKVGKYVYCNQMKEHPM